MGKIIWLASYPKSGNTWMRAFLHNLLRDPEDGYELDRLADYSQGDSHGDFYQKFLRKPLREMTDEEIAILRPKVQEFFTKSTPDNVFVKTHNALVEYLDRPLHYMEHTAGGIYIVRNPLDMIISLADHYGRSIDDTIELASREDLKVNTDETHAYEIQCSWTRNVESWTAQPSPKLHVMRYEDMTARPMEAFGGLVQFLRLPVDRDRLRRAIELSSFDSLRKKEEQHGFRERSPKSQRFFRQGKAGVWRDVLTPAQVEAVVATHELQMRRFGYWPVKDWSAQAKAAGIPA
jgi:sulfotransferase family protein